MQKFLQKFDELYKGKTYIEIEFLTDTPLTKKFVRYNQSGEVCYSLEGQTTGSQKAKNGWQPIECNTEQCQYRQKNEQGKCACNRIAWLKFFIPDICQDRMWLMKITGQTSINRLDSYINLQKALGNPLKGRYILFLKQEEQISKATGQTFNNYVLDLLKKEDFIQINQTPQINKTSTESSTPKVNDTVVNKETSTTLTQITDVTAKSDNKKTTKKTNEIKDTKNTSKKANKNDTKTDTEKTTISDEFANHYILADTFEQPITNKQGETKQYVIGNFYDTNDKQCEIVIKPEYAEELKECEFGTVVELEIKEVLGRKFAINLNYVSKLTKKQVA